MKTPRAVTKVRNRKRGGGMQTLPCRVCGANVAPSQVERNRDDGVYDNLCRMHASHVKSRLRQFEESPGDPYPPQVEPSGDPPLEPVPTPGPEPTQEPWGPGPYDDMPIDRSVAHKVRDRGIT